MERMKTIYALREHHEKEKVHLVLLLQPALLARALENLKAGHVPEALNLLRQAADLYAGYPGEPPHELYEALREKEGAWQGMTEIDPEALEELEDYRTSLQPYPVLTGGEGLTLLLAFDWYVPEAGDIEAYALAHLPPELLSEAAKMDRLEEEDPAFQEALRRALAEEGVPLSKEELARLILDPEP